VSKQLDGTGMKRLHRTWRDRTAGRVALILDGLGTPANVGAIARTAAAYRVEHVWLAGPTPSFDSPGVARTALGTDRYLEATAVATTLDAIAEARADGYAVHALELTDNAAPLHDAVLPDDVCLVIGHEDHGVGKGALAACDGALYLPMLGKVGSLNVATATAIAVYELRRRSWAAVRE
jgi:tRNA (guanosine-2'-O-)-methyltransferase